MKQRLLVMNGQRIVQKQEGETWVTEQIDKAQQGEKPGVHHLHAAQAADRSKTTEGTIIHTDKQHVFQQAGKTLVMHDRASFDKVPAIGMPASISYADGKAQVAVAAVKLSRGLSR